MAKFQRVQTDCAIGPLKRIIVFSILDAYLSTWKMQKWYDAFRVKLSSGFNNS